VLVGSSVDVLGTGEERWMSGEKEKRRACVRWKKCGCLVWKGCGRFKHRRSGVDVLIRRRRGVDVLGAGKEVWMCWEQEKMNGCVSRKSGALVTSLPILVR